MPADAAVTPDALEAILREAGALAMADYRAGESAEAESWDKDDDSPVCEADIAVDKFLREKLTALLPGSAWLSEESADDKVRLSTRHVWIVDPIDGTRDYLRGRDGWAISVALVEDGLPVFGALYAPARDLYVHAEADRGAWINGERIRASTCVERDGARFPSHDRLPREWRLTEIERPNSIALRLLMVATDDADCAAGFKRGNEWDIAAAALIAQEAGATVTDLKGGALTFNQPIPTSNGILVAAPGIHGDILTLVAEEARKRDAG